MPRINFSDQQIPYHSKSERTKQPPLFPHPRAPSLPLIVILALCFLKGVSGVVFSLFVVLRRRPVPTFRCGRVEDTFRAFYSLPDARGDSGTDAVADRPKFVGLVGIQTGFGSGNRRKALRSTWFPSDPDSLIK